MNGQCEHVKYEENIRTYTVTAAINIDTKTCTKCGAAIDLSPLSAGGCTLKWDVKAEGHQSTE